MKKDLRNSSNKGLPSQRQPLARCIRIDIQRYPRRYRNNGHIIGKFLIDGGYRGEDSYNLGYQQRNFESVLHLSEVPFFVQILSNQN